MLRFLFPRLTPPDGQGLFDALVGEARQPHWYTEGGVPDSVDGRFAVLATVLALAIVRLEQGGGPAGRRASVALTERFVETMDAEHRQMGVSDPAIGKHVRKLVTSLGRRVEQWRQALDGRCSWDTATIASMHGGRPDDGVAHCRVALEELWRRLESGDEAEIAQGRIG